MVRPLICFAAALVMLSARPALATTLLTSGWEAGPTGCGPDELLDAGAWREYGSSNACASECNAGGPDASIVISDVLEGSRALEVHFPPSSACGINGPDFRVLADLALSTELYARFYVKWSDEWVWATADHKVAIFGLYDQTQDVYFNIRGQQDPTRGRVALYAAPSDVVFSDPNHEITRGVWYLLEIHMVAGPHGSLAARVDGVDLALEHEAGTPGLTPDDVDTGSGFNFIKLDTTYNDYAFAIDNGATMRMVYDAVEVNDGDGWIGPVDGRNPSTSSASSASSSSGDTTSSSGSSGGATAGAGGAGAPPIPGAADEGCAMRPASRNAGGAAIAALVLMALILGARTRRPVAIGLMTAAHRRRRST
jgi:hypothetical protein